jgi:solute carrier family 25 carnitine/acylcarnitine transporter 20/29
MLAGGLSGFNSWLFAYPFDLIKTTMQTTTHKHLSFLEAVRLIYKLGGIRSFFKGFGPTLVWTFVSNSFVMPIYERTRQTMLVD